ncbi:MAG TPA: transcriptional regulator, partial [Arenibaculum sp.]|nr:transcriptional regulator [Arenibaculum sp.]
NRIGASRLFDIAQTLDVPVGFFFDDMPEEVAALAHRRPHDQGSSHLRHRNLDSNVLLTRETTALLRAFGQITDPEIRRRTLELLRTLAHRLGGD